MSEPPTPPTALPGELVDSLNGCSPEQLRQVATFADELATYRDEESAESAADPQDDRPEEVPAKASITVKFIHRLACVCEEYGISLEAESEAWTSQTCPECGNHEATVRHEDTLTCPCGFEGHADLTASETFLREHSDTEVRPMARPVRFEWDDHKWSGQPHPHESPKEARTNPQVASVGR